jgi:hydrogenase nickel incorporation protein HypA/HybF
VHEVSLVEALFDQAERAIAPHAATAVRRVTVRIGELAGVDAELFRTAFEGCKDARGYGAAALEIVGEAAAWRCAACGAAVAADGPLQCGACDGVPRLAAGGDLILQRLELDVPLDDRNEETSHV